MKLIVLISCSSKKLDKKAKAIDLYSSTLFKKSINYARFLNPDKIYILSALHGLVDINEELDPYNTTLKKLSKIEILEWAKKVIENLKTVSDIENDIFVILAGKEYIDPISQNIKNLNTPLKGLRIGERIKYLNKNK